jgi:hypothetical protein
MSDNTTDESETRSEQISDEEKDWFVERMIDVMPDEKRKELGFDE